MNEFDTFYEAIINEVDIPDEVVNWFVNVFQGKKQIQQYNKYELECIKNQIYPRFKNLTAPIDIRDRRIILNLIWKANPENALRKKELTKQSHGRQIALMGQGLAGDALELYIRTRMLKKARVRASNPKSPKEFNITVQDVLSVWPKDNRCPVLEVPLQKGTGTATDYSPSLDRIDSAKGYVPGNIVVMSFLANQIKNDATWQELERIADYIEGKI
jgi:hypothetical protein